MAIVEQPPQETENAQATTNVLGAGYAEPALERVRTAIRGNGVKPESVTANKVEGQLAEYDAEISLILRTRTMEKILPGKKTTGEKVQGPQGVRDAVEKERLKVLSSKDTVVKIRNIITERKDKGFGIRNEVMKLPFLTKEYIHHQACRPCGAQGKIKCPRCHGKGHEVCPRCHGQAMEMCTQCRGAQLVYMGNGQQTCPKCNGQGRTPCLTCHQTRKIICNICKAHGSTQCQNCSGQGWQSYVTTAEIDVVGTYSFTRDHLPEALLKTIEARAKEIPGHANIAVIPPPAVPAIPDDTQKPDEILMHYKVSLPYAKIEVSFGKGDAKAFAFLLGKQAEITDISNFLEPLLRRGMNALQEAAEGRGNVAEKISRAGQYRTIRQAIFAAAKYSNAKATGLLLKNTPIGLGEKTATALVENADRALKKITAQPRRNGVITGIILAAALYLIYMLTPLRDIIIASTPDTRIHIAIDGAAMAAGMMISVFTIQIFGSRAIKKALKKILPPDQKNTIVSKAGNSGLWSALLCFFMFLLAAEASVQLSMHAPDWYTVIRQTFTTAPPPS